MLLVLILVIILVIILTVVLIIFVLALIMVILVLILVLLITVLVLLICIAIHYKLRLFENFIIPKIFVSSFLFELIYFLNVCRGTKILFVAVLYFIQENNGFLIV